MGEDISALGAAIKLRKLRQDKVTAENTAEPVSRSNEAVVASTPSVSASDAIKNESVGSEGERSFGAPVQGSAFDRQSTDSNN